MYASELWYFRRLGINSRLPDDVLNELKKQGHIERWGHRAKIHHEHDDDDIYVILGGNVFIENESAQGQTRLQSGDIYGQTGLHAASLRENKGKNSSLTAFDDTTLCGVSQDTFREITCGHIGNIETLIGGWLSNRSVVTIPIMPLLCTSPASRVARVLLHLAETHGEIVNDTAQFAATLKPAQIGRLIGLDAAHVRVLLMHFVTEGIVTVSGKKVQIPSVELVRSLSVQPA